MKREMKKLERANNHTFVICAYKKSEFLEDCIQSLMNQTVKTNIIISTSTPNSYINNMAEKYKVPVFINKGKSGIGEDWNFGVSCTTTPLVTIAHQDDTYNKNYVEEIEKLYEKYSDFSIAFGNYRELKNNETIPITVNLKIKRFLLKSLLKNPYKKGNKMKTVKYGNAICCPAVTLNIDVVGKEPFITGYKSNLDWYTWYKFALLPNPFAYVDKELMQHRIHEESTTSSLIENNVRLDEDYDMFGKFWPKPIAKFIMRFYKKAVKTNG